MHASTHARELIAYNGWANRKLIEAIGRIDDAALTAPAAASRGSILDTMAHLVTAQGVWLSRWNGEPPPTADLGTRDGVISAIERAQQGLEAFAESLADPDWERIIDYGDSAGVPHSVSLGRLLTHVVNHGTLHRGEAGFQLGLLGASPGDMDYVFFTFEQDGASR